MLVLNTTQAYTDVDKIKTKEIKVDLVNLVTIIGSVVSMVVPCVALLWYVINLRLSVIESKYEALVRDRKEDLEFLKKIDEKLDNLTTKLLEKYVSKEQCERNMANCTKR